MSGVLQAVFQNQRSFGPAPDSQSFTTAGTFSWVAPANVTSVAVVAVGGGGGAAHNSFNPRAGGGGGELRYTNGISVTPGGSYTVVVGAGGGCHVDGGSSYFNASNPLAYGGIAADVGGGTAGVGGSGGTGTGGGNGGGSSGTYSNCNSGGGGAGGYSGNGGLGGAGGANCSCTTGAAGSGGAGGGGPGGRFYYSCVCYGTGPQYIGGGGGGGVGLLGQGTSGGSTVAGRNNLQGKGGSGGTDGIAPSATACTTQRGGGKGGAYGGGAGGPGSSGSNPNVKGGDGAVRIVWGTGRSFPSTNVGSP